MKHKLYTAWISVEDELPYESGDYLVAYNIVSYEAPGKNAGIMLFNFNKLEWIGVYRTVVTHWMALPSPPGNNEQA